MQQLPLEIRLADFALFATYFAGPNQAAVQALQQAAQAEGPQVHWLWGRSGSGRSHLLQASVAAAAGQGRRCAWLPLAGPAGMDPAVLEGMGNLDLLCVDDADSVAAEAGWERALFRVYEELRGTGGRLVLSASCAPGDAGFALPDLASRLASGPTWRLRELADEELQQALQLRAQWRGLELSDEAAAYLLRRVTRATDALFALLDVADRAALAAQRRLTIPFLRSVLESDNAN